MLPRLFWSSYPRDHLHLHPFPTRRSSDLSSETIWTSRMSGTECSTLGCSPSSAATIALETRFFAPRTVISPLSGRPPRTWNVELMVSLLRWTGAPGRPVSDPVTLPERAARGCADRHRTKAPPL